MPSTAAAATAGPHLLQPVLWFIVEAAMSLSVTVATFVTVWHYVVRTRAFGPGQLPRSVSTPAAAAEMNLSSSLGRSFATPVNTEENLVGLILFVLLLALLLGGLGFAAHSVWIIAVVVFFAWLVGFGIRMGEGSRWYRW